MDLLDPRNPQGAGLLLAIVESAPDALLAVESGRIRMLNRQAEALFGYRRDELIGEEIELLVPESVRGRHAQQRADYEANPRVRSMGGGLVLYGCRKDGTEIPVEISLSPLLGGEGGIVLACVRDVTARRRMEEALRESEQRFRAIFDQEYQLVGLLSVDGVVLEANRAALAVIGASLDQVVGKPFWETAWWRKTTSEPDDVRHAVAAAVRGEFVRFDVELEAREGVRRWIDFSIKPVCDDGGAVVFLLPEGRDVTSMKCAQHGLRALADELEARNAELDRSNEDLDDFAYIASHDLKEPLRGIGNYAAFLLEDEAPRLTAEGVRMLETIGKLCTRFEGLIDSLLQYSRVGSGETWTADVDMNEVLRDVVEGLQVTLEQDDVDIRVPDLLPTVRGDAVRIREVLHNLLTNAVKYNDSDAKWVEVGCRQDGGERIFYVRDNGIGIQEKHLENVFTMFKRLHGRDRYGGGTGAGLSIARKIIERHGGRVWVESTPGKGSTFCFTLPTSAL